MIVERRGHQRDIRPAVTQCRYLLAEVTQEQLNRLCPLVPVIGGKNARKHATVVVDLEGQPQRGAVVAGVLSAAGRGGDSV